MIANQEDDSEFTHENVESDEFEHFHYVSIEKIDFPEGLWINTPSNQITIKLGLTIYDKKNDPILVLLPALKRTFKLPKEQILKNLYLFFLDINEILIKDENGAVINYDYIRLQHLKVFKPYNWSGNIHRELEYLSKGKVRYSFLNQGQFKRENPLSIQFNGEEGECIRKTLDLLCKKLNRSRPSFFKMLLMYYFQTAGLVDENFQLKSDWGETLNIMAIDWEMCK